MQREAGVDIWDVLAALGVVLIGVGLGLVAPWLGVTVTGVLLLVAGITGGVLAGRAESGAGPAGASRAGGR